MTLDDLHTRIKRLEEIEAIKKLRATYCYLVDARDYEAWLGLFTEDAKGDYGPFGKYEGRAGMRKFIYEVVGPTLPFLIHMVHDPIIEVDGDRATGKWYFDVPATYAPVPQAPLLNRALWIQGRYEEEYLKEDGEWKFSSIKANFIHITPFDEGWVKTKSIV